MIFFTQTKVESITRAQKKEARMLQSALVPMLAEIPYQQWQWEDPAQKYLGPRYLTRIILKTTTPTGAKAKIIRDMVRENVTPEDRKKFGINYHSKYELYIDRLCMSSEHYLDETPPTGSIGELFETIESQIILEKLTHT